MDSYRLLGPSVPAPLPELSTSVRSSVNCGVHCRGPRLSTPHSDSLLAPWMLPSPLPPQEEECGRKCVPRLCFSSHNPQA